MTSWTEILKANKGLYARDSFSELWGLKLKAARAEFPDYTITGTLPLSFNSRVAGALKNYRLYGDSDGSGEETENLVDVEQWLDDRGATYTFSDGTYTIDAQSNLYSSPWYFSQENIVVSFKGKISNVTATSTRIDAINADGTLAQRYVLLAGQTSQTENISCAGFRMDWSAIGKIALSRFMVVKGSTVPTTFIPFGYKIPILNTSGVTKNLFDKDATDTNNGYVNRCYIKSNGTLTNPGYSWIVSEYMPVEPNANYTIGIMLRGAASTYNAFYDVNKELISTFENINDEANTFTTPANAAYIRLSIRTLESETDIYMFVKGNTLPDHYIPHRYESNYDLFIGSTKLGAEEYVDYQEQKVYKYAEPLKIYGWHVDPSISDSANAITYLGDAVGKTPATMGAEAFSYGDWSDAFFMPKPCMVKSDGTVDYYLDPNDYTKKADGTASDVANPDYDGNAMMEWPLIWWKYEAGETEGEGYFYVSNRKVDDSFNCWCNYNCDDKIVSHFYTAIYNGTGTSKMRSISGVTLTSANGNGGTTATQEITRATANNTTDKTEWYIDVWSDCMLINGLLILMGKSLNSQAVFGRGLDAGGQTAKEAYVTGALNDKGLFWGDTSAGTSGVKVFGMENYWGCVWHRTAGLIGLSNGNTAYKLTYGTVDGTTADGYNTNGNGYLVDTTARPANGYFKTAKFGKFGYLPLTTGGSSTTYYSDYWYTNNSALIFALVGGGAHVGLAAGCSCFTLNVAPGYADWSISSSLSFKPLAKTVPEPDLTPTDPPVPLPAIQAYKGENALSSTETVGEVSITGKITEMA